jgi:hypothetical protein
MDTSEDWRNLDIDDEFKSIVEPYFNNEIEKDELLAQLRIFKKKYNKTPDLKGIVQGHIMLNAINIPSGKGFFAKVYPRQFPADDNTFLEVLKIFISSAKAEQINQSYIDLLGGGRRRTKLRKKKT